MSCGTERIDRFVKEFYPRNDTVDATISALLPRDGNEDIFLDQHGDPVYLERSSILDGVKVKGFGYVGGKPYKWNLEIETAVKSVALVPDRFFSIYGKSYPIKRSQTIGINQPSELFKYEIVYLRGYDAYKETAPLAKIIYHSQNEGRPVDDTCAAKTSDNDALKMLDDYKNYPYLKLRVCLDGSVRAYLGTPDVDWDLTRQIEESHADPDINWVEVPQINTEQFRNLDLWVRFDSINALSYYLMTKYGDNIFDIGPKDIKNGLTERPVSTYYSVSWTALTGLTDVDVTLGLKAGTTFKRREVDATDPDNIVYGDWENVTLEEDGDIDGLIISINANRKSERILSPINKNDAVLLFINSNDTYAETPAGGTDPRYQYSFTLVTADQLDGDLEIDGVTFTQGNSIGGDGYPLPAAVAGKDYNLTDSEAIADAECTPCCKKSVLSRAIWAYINPKTMQPYDDDYWFHQGEPYFKKSLTLSTKQNPIKAKRIVIEQGTFPGMYKIVCETYIRERITGEDERVQITLPLCKIKSDQTLTLQADGDPTTFSLQVEVATPPNGVPMEMTFYEVEKEMKQGCNGSMVPKDGSTRVVMG